MTTQSNPTFSISERNYSWGDFYDTLKSCDGYTEEQRKEFLVFETLDKANTFEEIKQITSTLSEQKINWLNSPCLDGILFSLKGVNPVEKLMIRNYPETCKYYMAKKLLDPTEGLVYACFYGHKNLASLFLENGANTEYKDNLALWTACRTNRIDIIEMLLQKISIPVNNCIMHISIENNNVQIVKMLLEKKLATKFLEYLYDACKFGFTEIARLILEHSKPNNIDWINHLFINACGTKHIDIVKLFLEYGADIHTRDESALRIAIYHHNYELMQFLIKNGANPTARDVIVSAKIHLDKTPFLSFITEYRKGDL